MRVHRCADGPPALRHCFWFPCDAGTHCWPCLPVAAAPHQGCALREMWQKSQPSLHAERKSPIEPAVPRAAGRLHSTNCAGLRWCPVASPAGESLSEDSERKVSRKHESEETAEWGRSRWHGTMGGGDTAVLHTSQGVQVYVGASAACLLTCVGATGDSSCVALVCFPLQSVGDPVLGSVPQWSHPHP